MNEDIYNVENHVRYALTLVRANAYGRYVAMQTSFEVAETVDLVTFETEVSRRVRRDLTDDENREGLAVTVGKIFCNWLKQCQARRCPPLIMQQGDLIVWVGSEMSALVAEPTLDCLQISIFTKKDEAEMDELLRL